MLDKQTGTLLTAINTLCAGGGYQIIEESELAERAHIPKETVAKTADYLKERGYIDIRYEDDGVYCLSTLPEGREYFETAQKEQSDEWKRKRNFFFFTLTASLFGSFAGAFIAALLLRLF